VALGLPDGGVGGPVDGPGGVYVVKLLARERPDPTTFGAARAELEARLLREKRARLWQAWLGAARAGAKIEINRQLLSDG
jgi:parvulin-like peptidyl-prolyl isomerase